jgi:hypothetical protein
MKMRARFGVRAAAIAVRGACTCEADQRDIFGDPLRPRHLVALSKLPAVMATTRGGSGYTSSRCQPLPCPAIKRQRQAACPQARRLTERG